MEKELEGLEEEEHWKKYQTRKYQAMMAYLDSGFKSWLLSTTVWLLKWLDAYKKQPYPNGWPK